MDAQNELRKLLVEEWEEARSRNSAYSLRAYARRIGLQPSALSEILNGKRPITRRMGAKIMSRLGMDAGHAENLRAQLKGTYRGGPVASVPRVEFHQLSSDQFHVLSDWYCFAIRSLSETAGFRDDPKWIARRLGIQIRQARAALQRMERLGLMERDGEGCLRTTNVQLTTMSDVANLSLQRAHRKHLELAADSLTQAGVDERDITGITMAIDPVKIPEAKERIRKFRRELCAFLESGSRKEVYRMNVQLFPMTKGESK